MELCSEPTKGLILSSVASLQAILIYWLLSTADFRVQFHYLVTMCVKGHWSNWKNSKAIHEETARYEKSYIWGSTCSFRYT